jgi:pimeloyl-ACP methyl ester carboxylesterase
MEPTDGKQQSNILLVHGAFADGSIWGRVIETLQYARFNVVACQLPLTSFTDDVRTVKQDLVGLHGPTVVVGHSYGGNVITQATSGAADVAGLVYVAAFAPDTGETIDSIRTQYPPLPSAQYFVPVDPSESPPFLIMQRDHVHQFFCQDVEPRKAQALAATEGPTSATVFTAPIQGSPAWRQFPTWYQISTTTK